MSGESRAYEALVTRYQHYVFTIAFNILKSREEAEEAAQDAFLKAFKMLRTYQGKARFSTWLYTIAYRAAIDLGRKKKRRYEAIDGDESHLQIEDTVSVSPIESVNKKDLQYHLDKAITKLKPQDATIVTLFYLHERTVKEISAITGLTITNVKTKLFRIRENLKVILQKELHKEIQEWL